jgi:hypothetical protein
MRANLNCATEIDPSQSPSENELDCRSRWMNERPRLNHASYSAFNDRGERHKLPFRLKPNTKARLKAKVVNQTGATENYRLLLLDALPAI